MTPNDFLNIINKGDKGTVYKLGTIDHAYLEGRPKVIFDGESIASNKKYTRLSSYEPRANDRVLLLKASGTYTILGKVI